MTKKEILNIIADYISENDNDFDEYISEVCNDGNIDKDLPFDSEQVIEYIRNL